MANNKGHELDAAERNAMPDSEYAFPRLRKEPLSDARHVRNAIARFDQVQGATDDERAEAFRRLQKAAKKFGVDMTETRWQELGKPTKGMKSSDKPQSPSKSGSASDDKSKSELYAEARRRGIGGRSSMTKDQLARALRNA
jgi:hypothetical protein